MRTDFSDSLLATEHGARANEILRSCVHCGFCNATCPTYQITGDELDGPRGRIYLIRDLLETGENTDRATHHLDSCLTCRACETTCPSGVAYGELAEIARNELGHKRSGVNGALRNFLAWMVPNAKRLRLMARLGKPFRFLLPSRLSEHIPSSLGRPISSKPDFERKVLMLNGCAQQVSTPLTNEHVQRLLSAKSIGTIVCDTEGCCGSLDLHAGKEQVALDRIRVNVDNIYPYIAGGSNSEDGDEKLSVEAVISTASGCGVTYKDYGRLLQHDTQYANRARIVSERVVDVAEFLQNLGGFEKATPSFSDAQRTEAVNKVAWHSPCTLQHGQGVVGVVETLLTEAGYELVSVRDPHLCCGSAGSYSMLQPKMSQSLRAAKLEALQTNQPDVIATANVGCQSHLGAASQVPVVHWSELLG